MRELIVGELGRKRLAGLAHDRAEPLPDLFEAFVDVDSSRKPLSGCLFYHSGGPPSWSLLCGFTTWGRAARVASRAATIFWHQGWGLARSRHSMSSMSL